MYFNKLFELESYINGPTNYQNKKNMNKDTKEAASEWQIKNIGTTKALHKKDNVAQCIYKMPTMLPHPNIQGQVIIQNPICCDNCPMFELTEGLFSQLTLHCTGRKLKVYVFNELPGSNLQTSLEIL
jgi:hypothetical protein